MRLGQKHYNLRRRLSLVGLFTRGFAYVRQIFVRISTPGDLKTRRSTDTSQIEIHFSIKTIEFLMTHDLLCFQISGTYGRIIFFTL